MSLDLAGIDARIEWADEHIAQLESRFPVFQKRKPYETFVKANPDPAQNSDVCLKINEPAATEFLREVALRTGDVVHSLRAALDYLTYAAVPVPTAQTAFPVWRDDKRPIPTAAQYKSAVLRKVKGAPSDFIKLCLAIEPYFGGNHEAIRILDYLDIVNKHRLIIEALASIKHVGLDFGATLPEHWGLPADRPEMRLNLVPEERFPLKDGDPLFSAPLETIRKMKPELPIEVVLGEPKAFAGRPVVPALTELSEFVKDLIDQFRRVL